MNDEEKLAERIASMVVERLSAQLEAIVRSLISERDSKRVVPAPAADEQNPRWKKWWKARSAAGERLITHVKAPDGTPGRKKYRAVLDCGHERRLAFYGVDNGDDAPPQKPEDTVGMRLTCVQCLKAFDTKHAEPPRRS